MATSPSPKVPHGPPDGLLISLNKWPCGRAHRRRYAVIHEAIGGLGRLWMRSEPFAVQLATHILDDIERLPQPEPPPVHAKGRASQVARLSRLASLACLARLARLARRAHLPLDHRTHKLARMHSARVWWWAVRARARRCARCCDDVPPTCTWSGRPSADALRLGLQCDRPRPWAGVHRLSSPA